MEKLSLRSRNRSVPKSNKSHPTSNHRVSRKTVTTFYKQEVMNHSVRVIWWWNQCMAERSWKMNTWPVLMAILSALVNEHWTAQCSTLSRVYIRATCCPDEQLASGYIGLYVDGHMLLVWDTYWLYLRDVIAIHLCHGRLVSLRIKQQTGDKLATILLPIQETCWWKHVGLGSGNWA